MPKGRAKPAKKAAAKPRKPKAGPRRVRRAAPKPKPKPARRSRKTAEDRRTEERTTVQIPVLYHVADGVEERVSATLNLSVSGLQFPSRRKLADSDRLMMRLLIPGEIRPLMLHGVVRWVTEDGGGDGVYNVGVAFERAEAEIHKTLKRFLAR